MKLGKDKLYHLIAGFFICILGWLFYPLISLIPFVGWVARLFSPILFAFLLAALVGALKELVWDKWWKKGTPEWLDFWATVLGGLIGVIFLLF